MACRKDEISVNVDTTELEEEDLPDIIEEIEELSGRYENIGTCLRVKASAVDRIKSEGLNSDGALKEILREWLKKNYNAKKAPGPPSWKTLVEAVARPSGGNNRALAEKIAAKHQGGAATPSSVDSASGRSWLPTITLTEPSSTDSPELVIGPKDPNFLENFEAEKVEMDGGESVYECFQPNNRGVSSESIAFSFGSVTPITSKKPLKNSEVGTYNMNRWPHGKAVIINNENFASKKLNTREGTEKDEKNLVSIFQYLGYVVEVHRDRSSQEICMIMEKVRKEDHSNYDSFICCILSHGDSGKVYGKDGKSVPLQDITDTLNGESCSSLADKPKLFFLQACRGKGYDKAVTVKTDGGEGDSTNEGARVATDGEKIPSASDFFFGFATPLGNKAFRDLDNGSWYISELCRCLACYSRYLSLDKIMTITNARLSTYSTYNYKENMQSAETVSRLRKDIFFF